MTTSGIVARYRLSLLGGFHLEARQSVPPTTGEAQRLLAFLALQGRAVQRTAVAGTLWPEVPDGRAQSSLRSSLARLDDDVKPFLDIAASELAIAPDVNVDWRDARSLARRLLRRDAPVRDGDLDPRSVELLSGALLPDWYEEWALEEAEDWRQLRLHALEALTERLVTEDRFAEAAVAALAAIKIEPLRESAHVALVRVHIAEGNQSEALRQYARYERLLASELGLEPTLRLRELIKF